MATKLENLEIEIKHFENFAEHIPGFNQMCLVTVQMLLEMGGIQMSTLFEQALANIGDHQVISLDESDLSDGSDAKTSTVRTGSYGTVYSAPVSKIKTKTGMLRVQVYERIHDKFYYFKIPYSAYKDIPPKSNIEIRFDLEGNPQRVPKGKLKYANFWDFEVATFEELAT